MTTNGNGPAYELTKWRNADFPAFAKLSWSSGDLHCESFGLTKREWLAGLLSAAIRQAHPSMPSDAVARSGVADADALLAELNKAEKGGA